MYHQVRSATLMQLAIVGYFFTKIKTRPVNQPKAGGNLHLALSFVQGRLLIGINTNTAKDGAAMTMVHDGRTNSHTSCYCLNRKTSPADLVGCTWRREASSVSLG